MKNILFSTTRQWNPGDEFILFGILNILKDLKFEFNPIIFNRNPDIRPCDLRFNKKLAVPYNERSENRSFRGQSIIQSHFRDKFCDNSWRDGMNGDYIDYVIFAGTPEWYGSKVRSLYKTIRDYEIGVSFLGIGAGNYALKSNDLYTDIWTKADLITTRDKKTAGLLSEFNAIYITCPSILAARRTKRVKEVNRIALVHSMSNTHIGNRVGKDVEEYLRKIYTYMISNFECDIICHYIDEVFDAKEKYPGTDVVYSYDAKDYLDIYYRYDFVIGARVHAMGICASMGIPGVAIVHDLRAETVNGFLSDVIDARSQNIDTAKKVILNAIDNISIKSSAILEKRNTVHETYKHYISSMIAI